MSSADGSLFLSPVFGERSGTHLLLTCPYFLAVPQPALPCCCGGETWVMAGFERDLFICLEPQVPPLTCFEHLHPGLHLNGAPLVLPPTKAGQSLCPCASGSVTISVLVQFWLLGHGATWSGAWAGTSPCCPSCCPSSRATAASGLRFDPAPCVGCLCLWLVVVPAASRPSAVHRVTLVCGGHG